MAKPLAYLFKYLDCAETISGPMPSPGSKTILNPILTRKTLLLNDESEILTAVILLDISGFPKGA